eukprot:CAMPEP_0204563756 /NCGR_PEP_ID=MMETSP0661-20131031/34505_1 /ASSEMBLY_ACC=CAM_ASM_000606 /TAXON_ID=109239 /ORGANISM="Alexandrium margalefi, Strain AMGDE01CS-322" /LENGTH=115 /DNA_ID=CAMNT_0051571345 /DNA_START=187 /DNA_END=531 /DNA_ORIENTATION=+
MTRERRVLLCIMDQPWVPCTEDIHLSERKQLPPAMLQPSPAVLPRCTDCCIKDHSRVAAPRGAAAAAIAKPAAGKRRTEPRRGIAPTAVTRGGALQRPTGRSPTRGGGGRRGSAP